MGETEVTLHLIEMLSSDEFWESEANLVLGADSQAQEIDSLESWLSDQSSLKGHVFFQTSGSSGSPKWVAISKSSLLSSAQAVIDHLGMKIGSKSLLTIPVYHVGGFGVIARSYLCGGFVDLYRGKWNAQSFINQLEQAHAQYSSLVPAQVVDLVSLGCEAPACIQKVIIGGGHLSDELYQKAVQLGWPLLRSYGMSEAGSQIATGDNGDYWLNLLEGWEVSLSDDERLRIRGGALFSGYVSRIDDDYHFEDPKSRDGWYTTQDMVQLDGDRLKFNRRSGRCVKILGELVNLQTVEDNLSQQLEKEIIVVPIPEQRRGVILVAVTEDETTLLPEKSTRGLEAIADLFVIPEFPRSALGKIRRAAVEEWAKDRFAGDKTAD